MEIQAINSSDDQKKVLDAIRALSHASPGTPEYDRLNALETLLFDYMERRSPPKRQPDPIDIIEAAMKEKGLVPAQLVSMMGSPPLAAEVLNRRQPLTIDMIRRLSANLDLPVDILIRKYPLNSTD